MGHGVADPATVWGRAEDGHAPTTAEPCAELGIWIAEQFEKKSQLTSSASSKVLVPPAKGLQPTLQGHTINKQHVQPSLQPVPKSCSVAQGHLSINSIPRIFKDPTSATKQLHTKRSVQAHALTAVSMTPGDAVFRPSLGNCMQPYSLQLPSGRNNAATAAGLQTVFTNAEQQINQPAMQQNMGPAVGRPAHTDALSSMNTEPSSTSGTATMQSHSYLKASKQHLTSVQPGTPDFGDAPPQAFKRPRHMRNAPE